MPFIVCLRMSRARVVSVPAPEALPVCLPREPEDHGDPGRGVPIHALVRMAEGWMRARTVPNTGA